MVRNLKRKTPEDESPMPAKRSKFSLEVVHENKRPGKLYELDLYDDIDLSQETPIMEDAVDVKGTNEYLVIMDSNGKVFLRMHKASTFKELDLPLPAIKITAGLEHAACLLEDGQVFIWGSFENPGFMFRNLHTPVRILHKETIVDISSGRDHLIALNDNGIVFSMGCGAQGQLGRLSMRLAENGGRKGPSLLLTPHPVHMNKMQRAEKIWATRTGTFYRDAKTKVIYGCGRNVEGNVSPVEKKYKDTNFIYNPVKTTWSSVREMGEHLVLQNNGTLLVPSQDEESDSFSWEKISKTVSSIHSGYDNTHFISKAGDVYELKMPKRIPVVYVATENQSAKALGVATTDKNLYLIVN